MTTKIVISSLGLLLCTIILVMGHMAVAGGIKDDDRRRQVTHAFWKKFALPLVAMFLMAIVAWMIWSNYMGGAYGR